MAHVMRASHHLLQVSFSAYMHRYARVPSKTSVRTFRAAICGCEFLNTSHPRSGLTQQRRTMSKDSVRWLWPAPRDVASMDVCDRLGTWKPLLHGILNAAQPLQTHHLTQTLLLLQRRWPNLRACLRSRGETLWYCEPSQMEVNFEMLTDEDEDDFCKICERILDKPFTDTDPVMWRSMLVPRGDHVPCPVPEVKADFPYQYDYFFHCHHGLSDGMDGVLLLRSTMAILNDILAGRPEDKDKWGDFTDKEDLLVLRKSVRDKLMKNPKRISEVRSSMPPADSTPLLLEAFPKPNGVKPSTRYIFHTIEPAVTMQFQQKAREVGVSLNSAMLAAMNSAIVELVKDTGKVQDMYTLKALCPISLRPHLKFTSEHYIGPCISRLSHRSHVSQNVRNSFWEYTKKFHEELRSILKSRLVFEQTAVTEMTQGEVSLGDYLSKLRPVVHDYSLTNHGVIPKRMNDGFEHVKLTGLFPILKIHNTPHSNMHQFLILNDRCFYTLSYDTNYLSHETANLLADKVLSVVRDVSTTVGSEGSPD